MAESSRIDIPGVEPTYRGKVRDMYDLGETFLMVATDRISAFDVVFSEPIPEKGKVLNSLSNFWFHDPRIQAVVPNHYLESDPAKYPAPFRDHAELLRGRSMLVKKARRVDFECVVRGYISGSAWKEYKQLGTINGEKMPKGLKESDQLPASLFTPATKVETGHDENVSFSYMAGMAGRQLAERLRDISIELYNVAAVHARDRGLILADTKFEFGLRNGGTITLIDEALTPDSSRYWSAADYKPGKAQDSFDKQFVRDYLETLSWNKQPPPPPLPKDVIAGTADRYKEAYRLITGEKFS